MADAIKDDPECSKQGSIMAVENAQEHGAPIPAPLLEAYQKFKARQMESNIQFARDNIAKQEAKIVELEATGT